MIHDVVFHVERRLTIEDITAKTTQSARIAFRGLIDPFVFGLFSSQLITKSS